MDAHRAQFERHSIHLQFRTVPDQGARFTVRVVKGMIVQVLENLISNSVYWLAQERKLAPTFQPEITVEVDAVAKQVRLSDNGPGNRPARKEQIFQAFHSTKPPGAGSGLGLFIAREIAEYHDAELYWIQRQVAHTKPCTHSSLTWCRARVTLQRMVYERALAKPGFCTAHEKGIKGVLIVDDAFDRPSRTDFAHNELADFWNDLALDSPDQYKTLPEPLKSIPVSEDEIDDAYVEKLYDQRDNLGPLQEAYDRHLRAILGEKHGHLDPLVRSLKI